MTPLAASRGRSGGARGRSELAGRPGEWSDGEVYVAMPRPGGDAWVSIDRTSGAITSERTDRGWVSYLNDLHKGRNAGTAWFWFIDVFAVACIVFTLTGLLLLQMHARHRPRPAAGSGGVPASGGGRRFLPALMESLTMRSTAILALGVVAWPGAAGAATVNVTIPG